MINSKKFAKKSLGQNFLNSPKIRENIIAAASDIYEKNVLEIGPGLGFLTSKILEKKAHLTAIEFDVRACEILQRDFGHMPNFHLIQNSILDEDLDKLFLKKTYQILANIPYHITAPILRKLFAETKNKPTEAILMVQHEVAKKICDNSKRSILSISVEIFAEAEYLFPVSRENFTPIPKVDSAIIKLKTRENSLISPTEEQDFFTVVRAGFSRKRKKIGNVLGQFFGISSAKLLNNIDPNLRAEKLSIENWLEISRNFSCHCRYDARHV